MADKNKSEGIKPTESNEPKRGFLRRFWDRQVAKVEEAAVEAQSKSPEELRNDLGKGLIGTGADLAIKGASSSVAPGLIASRALGNGIGNYLANPERALDKLVASESSRRHESPDKVRSELVRENKEFRDEYKNVISDRSLLESMAREIPKQVVGELAGDKLHITNQFKTMVESGGSMKEFKDMQKKMPNLTLTGYVKFRDEANEEALRIGQPKRGLSEDAKKAGVKDYDTAIDHLKNKFIERGTKLQYDSIEKDLYGRSFLFSDATTQQQNPAQALAQTPAVQNAAAGIQQTNTPTPANNPALANNTPPNVRSGAAPAQQQGTVIA